MGVIDLDKRVKKLEQADVAGGAELDQLEAAVTAIENDLTVSTTDISDDFENVPEGVTVTALITIYGKIAFAVITVETSDTFSDAYATLDPAILPASDYSYIGRSSTVNAYFEEGYLVIGATDSGTATLLWIIDPPAPTPGE